MFQRKWEGLWKQSSARGTIRRWNETMSARAHTLPPFLPSFLRRTKLLSIALTQPRIVAVDRSPHSHELTGRASWRERTWSDEIEGKEGRRTWWASAFLLSFSSSFDPSTCLARLLTHLQATRVEDSEDSPPKEMMLVRGGRRTGKRTKGRKRRRWPFEFVNSSSSRPSFLLWAFPSLHLAVLPSSLTRSSWAYVLRPPVFVSATVNLRKIHCLLTDLSPLFHRSITSSKQGKGALRTKLGMRLEQEQQ